ncbi:hypothetical protein ACFLV4_03315 [Chloroflexota bacterium]
MRSISIWAPALVVTWLLVGIVLLSFYSKFDWNVLLGFATWVLAAGVCLAIWQLRETRQRTKLEYTERRLEELNSIESKEGLQITYGRTPSKLSELEKEERDKVVQVLERMHTLGLLIEQGYADKELAIEAHRGKFIRCCYKLRPCICYERKRRGKYGEGI